MAFNYSQLLSQLNPAYEMKREIVSVNGYNEAKNYVLNRGENIILRDANEDIIYVKLCDELGKSTIKVYECKEITEKVISESTSQTVSRLDFDKLSNELSEIKKMFTEVVNGKYNVKQNKEWNKSIESIQTVQQES